MNETTADRPVWDEKRAHALIGKRVLIGMTYTNSRGNRLEQMFGTIISPHPRSGFEVKLEGKSEGKTFWIPPHIEAIQPAPAREYRLKTTNEVVIDPDYTTMWTVEGKPEGSA